MSKEQMIIGIVLLVATIGFFIDVYNQPSFSLVIIP